MKVRYFCILLLLLAAAWFPLLFLALNSVLRLQGPWTKLVIWMPLIVFYATTLVFLICSIVFHAMKLVLGGAPRCCGALCEAVPLRRTL
mgnify:CR=1 FL=1